MQNFTGTANTPLAFCVHVGNCHFDEQIYFSLLYFNCSLMHRCPCASYSHYRMHMTLLAIFIYIYHDITILCHNYRPRPWFVQWMVKNIALWWKREVVLWNATNRYTNTNNGCRSMCARKKVLWLEQCHDFQKRAHVSIVPFYVCMVSHYKDEMATRLSLS